MNTNKPESEEGKCCDLCKDVKGQIHHCDCHPLSLGSNPKQVSERVWEEDLLQKVDFKTPTDREVCLRFIDSLLSQERARMIEGMQKVKQVAEDEAGPFQVDLTYERLKSFNQGVEACKAVVLGEKTI